MRHGEKASVADNGVLVEVIDVFAVVEHRYRARCGTERYTVPPACTRIDVLIERLKWRAMLWQMRESMLRQTMHVRVANDTQTIQFLLAQMTLGFLTLCNFQHFVTTKRHFRWSDKRVA